jgi:hypothetical protein
VKICIIIYANIPVAVSEICNFSISVHLYKITQNFKSECIIIYANIPEYKNI